MSLPPPQGAPAPAGDEALAGPPAATRVIPVQFLVTAWPEDLADNPDAASFCVTVARRSRGLWAVLDGSGDARGGGLCLGRDGTWSKDWPPEDAEERQEWLAAHWFPEEEAKKLARDAALSLVVSGVTTLEAIAGHRRREAQERAALPAATAGTGGQETVTNER